MSELDDLKEQQIALRDKIYEAETQDRITENTKMIGKCYRYRNTYGGGKNEWWWLYKKITGINKDGYRLSFSFETTVGDIIEIKRDIMFGNLLDGGYKEIPLEEFNQAWQDLRDSLPEEIK